jgi:hypothetical protein
VSTKSRILTTTINSLTLGAIVTEFSKFSVDDGKTTLEYIGQFILQCGEASANDMLKLIMFHFYLCLASLLLDLFLLLLILYLLGLN